VERIGNRRNRRLGLALGACLCLALLYLVALPALAVFRTGARAVELRELVVREVVEARALGSELVVLETVGERVVVPLFVPPEEGAAIRAAQAGQGSAALLVEQTVHGLGGELRAVILQPDGGSLGGLLLVEQAGAQRPIEIPPGAAIATAISTGQPILTTPEALESAGLDDEDLRRLAELERGEEAPPTLSL